MATEAELKRALQRANAAGDTQAVALFEAELKKMRPTEKDGFVDALKQWIQGDTTVGAAENVLSMGSAAVAEPVSGLAGMAAMPFVGGERAAEIVGDVQQGMSYQPRTAPGQEMQQATGQLLQPVVSGLQRASEATGELGYQMGGPVGGALGAALPAAILEIGALGLGAKAKNAALNQTLKESDVSQLYRNGQMIPEIKTALEKYGIDTTKVDQVARLDPAEAQRLGRAEEFDYTMTAGERGQDFGQMKSEQMQMEMTGPAGEQFRASREQAYGGLEQNLQNRVDALGVPDAAGQSIKEALDSRKSAVKQTRRQAYEALREAANASDLGLATGHFFDSVEDIDILRDVQVSNPGVYNAFDELMVEFGVDQTPTKVEELMNKGVEIKPLSLNNFERFRKRLGNIERSDQSGMLGNVTGPIRQALDQEVDLASKTLMQSDNVDISSLAKEARQSHIALMEEFDPKSLSGTLIQNKTKSNVPQIENSRVYQKIAAPSTAIEQVDSLVSSLLSEGPKGARALGDLQASILEDLMDSAFSAKTTKIGEQSMFSGTAFQNRFEKLAPKIEVVFKNNQPALDALNKANQLAKDLTPPIGARPKGSAGWIMEVLNKSGLYSVASNITGGNLLVEGLRELSESATNRKALQTALDTKPRLKATADIINTDYPALGAALGIGYLTGEEDGNP